MASEPIPTAYAAGASPQDAALAEELARLAEVELASTGTIEPFGIVVDRTGTARRVGYDEDLGLGFSGPLLNLAATAHSAVRIGFCARVVTISDVRPENMELYLALRGSGRPVAEHPFAIPAVVAQVETAHGRLLAVRQIDEPHPGWATLGPVLRESFAPLDEPSIDMLVDNLLPIGARHDPKRARKALAEMRVALAPVAAGTPAFTAGTVH